MSITIPEPQQVRARGRYPNDAHPTLDQSPPAARPFFGAERIPRRPLLNPNSGLQDSDTVVETLSAKDVDSRVTTLGPRFVAAGKPMNQANTLSLEHPQNFGIPPQRPYVLRLTREHESARPQFINPFQSRASGDTGDNAQTLDSLPDACLSSTDVRETPSTLGSQQALNADTEQRVSRPITTFTEWCRQPANMLSVQAGSKTQDPAASWPQSIPSGKSMRFTSSKNMCACGVTPSSADVAERLALRSGESLDHWALRLTAHTRIIEERYKLVDKHEQYRRWSVQIAKAQRDLNSAKMNLQRNWRTFPLGSETSKAAVAAREHSVAVRENEVIRKEVELAQREELVWQQEKDIGDLQTKMSEVEHDLEYVEAVLIEANRRGIEVKPARLQQALIAQTLGVMNDNCVNEHGE